MRIDVEAAYRQYGDMVLGRCRSLLHNDEAAREASQEVFLKLFRYRDRFRGDSSLSTFIFRIATNHCLNQIRSRKRRPEDPVEDMAPLTGHTDTMLSQIEGRQLVHQLLHGQDERTRECVVYHYMDGMTHQEIGDLMGISGAAVRKRIARFRQDLTGQPPAWLDAAAS